MSFAKDDGSLACATLVVLDLSTLQVVYEDFEVVRLEVPYVPGFLAFREVIGILSCCSGILISCGLLSHFQIKPVV